MKYDDYSWHYGGKFPKDLTKLCAATHIGIFFAWLVDNGLEGYYHQREHAKDLQRLRNRQMTGTDYLLKNCDGKLLAEDMSPQGNSFTHFYYGDEHNYGPYVEDYFRVLSCNYPSLYHVEDNWANYERIRPSIDQAYSTWHHKHLAVEESV